MRSLKTLGRGGRVLVAVAIGGAVFGIATAVQASIPDVSGVIHGCYNTSLAHGNPTGGLRVIDTSRPDGHCTSWEGSLDWNQTGPTGATGPTGPTGPAALADIYNADCSGVCDGVSVGNQVKTIWSKTLPAGSFYVTGKVVVNDSAAGTLFGCFLDDSSKDDIDVAQAETVGPSDPATLNLQHVITLASSDTLKLDCLGNGADAKAFPQYSELDAIPVGAVH